MQQENIITVHSEYLEEWCIKRYGGKLEFQKAFVDKCVEFDRYKEMETTNIDEYMRCTMKLRNEVERYFLKEFIVDEIDPAIIEIALFKYDADERKWYITYYKEVRKK